MLPKINHIKDITKFEHATRSYVHASLGGDLSKKDCAKCPQTIWINVFFDGTGNNFRKDKRFLYKHEEAKQSNIAKLAFFAWPIKSENIFAQDTTNARYRIYVPGVGTEFPEIGDSGRLDKALGNAVAWYGKERLDWAMDRLKQAIANHDPLIKKINIAIFGFSRGATLARAFARMLGKEFDAYENALHFKRNHFGDAKPMQIYFMGLLDTVASVGMGGSRLERIIRDTGKYTSPAGYTLFSFLDKGGHEGWADDLSIPPYVTQCIHYVASHECREKFPSDSVLQIQTAPSNSLEVFYPGMHSDIGGGYLPVIQEGRTNEFSRIVLNNLYREAWIAGVPLRSPSDIEKAYPGLFDISAELEAAFNEYMRGITDGNLQHQIIQHMDRYYSWRCARLRRLADKSLIPVGGVDHYMAITDREFSDDVKSIADKKTGYLRINTERHEDAIYREYHRSGAEGYRAKLTDSQKENFDKLFDKYIHDSIAGFKKNMEEGYLGFAENSRFSYARTMFVGKKDNCYYLWRYKGFLPESAMPEKQAMKAPEQTDHDMA